MWFVVGLVLLLLAGYIWRTVPPSAEDQELAARMARWIIFTVILSLAPLLIDYLAAVGRAHGTLLQISEVYAKGELCLIATALAGVATGEMFGLSERAKTAKIVLGGLCLLLAIGSIALYVMMKSNLDPLALPTYTYISGFLFILTFFASTSAIAVSELQK